MTYVRHEFSSPLTMLHRWRDNQGELVDALVLGYTLDLPFFEKYFVSTARGLGGRVTVLADAHRAVHSDVDVRQAGRTYQHAHVLCQGAFHPKLVVLMNDEHLSVAIGSGNPTTAGWGHNRELWLTIDCTPASGPRAMVDLSEWLAELGDVVHMPGWAKELLADIAVRLRPDDSESDVDDVRIIGNLTQPIIGQLPTGPTETLGLSAPFFDPSGRAVAELVEHFGTAELTLALQPVLGSFEGARLSAVAESVGACTIRYIDEQGHRLSHGKLVEWSVGGQRSALTGSANVTSAALRRTTIEGGNCELAVLCSVDDTLMPPGDVAELRDLAERRTFSAESEDESSSGVVLLGARFVHGQLEVEMVCRSSGDIELDQSPDGSPQSWFPLRSLGRIETGAHRFEIDGDMLEGRVLRARILCGEVELESNTVFVVDPVRCRPRSTSSAASRLAEDYRLADVFGDIDLAERFAADMGKLLLAAAKEASATSQGAPPSGVGAAGGSSADGNDRWSIWIDSARQRLKPSLAGLLFPDATEILRLGGGSWAIDPNEGDDITDDEDADTVDTTPSDDERRSAPDLGDTEMQRWRVWDQRLRSRVIDAEWMPLEVVLAVHRIHLDLLAAGLCGPDDQSWHWHLMQLMEIMVASVDPDELQLDVPEEVLGIVGAHLVIDFGLLFAELQEVGGDDTDMWAQGLWVRAKGLVALADDEQIRRQVIGPGRRYGRTVAEAQVIHLRNRARDDDPIAEATAKLESLGIPVELRNGVWVADLDEDAMKPREMLARIIEVVGAPCAARVVTDKGVFLGLFVDQTLAYVDGRYSRWNFFDLTNFGSPMSKLTSPSVLTDSKDRTPFPKADVRLDAMCGRLGVSREQFQESVG